MTEHSTPAAPSVTSPAYLILFAVALACGLVYGAATSLRAMPCWALAASVVVVAFPIWFYAAAETLLARRAILADVTSDQGWVRRFFWSGRLVLIGGVFPAILWAAALVAAASQMGAEKWAVIAIDVLLLSLAINPVQRRLAGEVRGERVGVVSRIGFFVFVNVLLLALAFAVLDLAFVGFPDTRGAPWLSVVSAAFAAQVEGSTCTLAGLFTGAAAAVEALARHAALAVIPALPDATARALAWTALLLQAGVVAYAITRVQLGSVALLEGLRSGSAKTREASTLSRTFVFTILFLAVPYLYLSLKASGIDRQRLIAGGHEVIGWMAPCTPDARASSELRAALNPVLAGARAEALQAAEGEIDRAVDAVFADVEAGVDRYLDWYFSVFGEYQRLLALSRGRIAEYMAREFEQAVFAGAGLAERLEAVSKRVDANSLARLSEAAGETGRRVRQAIDTAPCDFAVVDAGALAGLDRDQARAGMAAASGASVGAAVAAKSLIGKAGATVAAKVGGKSGFKAAAAMLGKAATKKGGSILVSAGTATAACAPTGPVAVLCGAVAGLVTWLTVDQVMVTVDEVRFRETMRAEMLEAIGESRAEIKAAMTLRHAAAVSAYAADAQSRLDRVFVPLRDGG